MHMDILTTFSASFREPVGQLYGMFCLLLKYNNKTVQYICLILWRLNFRGFLSMVIYEALYV